MPPRSTRSSSVLTTGRLWVSAALAQRSPLEKSSEGGILSSRWRARAGLNPAASTWRRISTLSGDRSWSSLQATPASCPSTMPRRNLISRMMSFTTLSGNASSSSASGARGVRGGAAGGSASRVRKGLPVREGSGARGLGLARGGGTGSASGPAARRDTSRSATAMISMPPATCRLDRMIASAPRASRTWRSASRVVLA